MTRFDDRGGGLPEVGDHVFTADGESLGSVKDVSDRCFKIDAPMQPDYWLATDCVIGSRAGEVQLSFAREQLGDLRQAHPEEQRHTGIHRHESGTILL